MLKKIFAIYDSKAGAYLDPFMAVNTAVASRMLTAVVRDKGHDFGKFPEDYTLFELGDWDPVKGSIAQFSDPRPVVKALMLVEREAK